ncbi:MAG: FtsX-like permease family protein [Sphaerochaetaceae bacterium]|nr:FtsX-like permease family protein [Spirochaetales bacterium]MDY5500122.1 FtsX-like permease family protein [Sphaerochaetaceae bacterium]
MKVRRLLVARYGFSPENHHRQSNIRIVISLAFSMAAMLVILSAMHALASARLSDIRTYETFDLQVPVADRAEGEMLASELDAQERVDAFLVAEEPALLSGATDSLMVRIRYLPEELAWYDNMTLQGTKGWMPSSFVAWKCGVPIGGEMEIATIGKGTQARVVPKRTRCQVTGTFTSRDSSFDSQYLLASIDDAPTTASWYVAVVTGLDTTRVKHLVAKTRPDLGPQSWKELCSSLYGALRLEQLVVRFVFLVLLLIILLSVRRGIERLVSRKRREIGTLLAMGLSRRSIIAVFLEESLVSTVSGLLCGILLGCGVMHVVNRMGGTSLLFGLPVLKVDWMPTILVALFVFAGSLGMAYLGMRRTVSLSLMEMLRDD